VTPHSKSGEKRKRARELGESYYDDEDERRYKAYAKRDAEIKAITDQGYTLIHSWGNYPWADKGLFACNKDGVAVGEEFISVHNGYHLGLKNGIIT
jgi:hypothetical protein